MTRPAGLSVRLKLTLSYVAFLMVAGALLLAVVWVFLLRYVPDQSLTVPTRVPGSGGRDPQLFIPGRSDLWRAFGPRAAQALGALLVVGLVGGWVLAGRVLAPLRQITEATRRAGSGSLSHRIGLPGPKDEFRELADAFDGMLAQLEAHVGEQQRFAANASHELRTPLSITQTLLEVATRDPDLDVALLLDRLQGVNERAIDLTEALLLLSRAGREPPRDQVDLSLVVEEVAETLLPLAEQRGVHVEVSGAAATAVGSRPLLHQVATNLVQNAIVHNRRGDGRVQVSTAVAGDHALLVVENTGEPIDPARLARLTEPFLRGSERVHDDHGGVGLGLAIVQRIVQAHGGSLSLRAPGGGGLSVTVRLPLPGQDRGPESPVHPVNPRPGGRRRT